VITDDPAYGGGRERAKKSGDCQNLVRAKTSFLIARETCWPLKTVVCVLRGQGSDLGSARWVTRLTHSTDCRVEVVVIVPQVPWMYAGLKRMQISLDEILQENSLPGRHLRRAVEYLCNWEISTTLRLLHGYSPALLEAELRKGHPDLIVISAHEPNLLPGVFQDDLVGALVSHGETSLLVDRSIRREQWAADSRDNSPL